MVDPKRWNVDIANERYGVNEPGRNIRFLQVDVPIIFPGEPRGREPVDLLLYNGKPALRFWTEAGCDYVDVDLESVVEFAKTLLPLTAQQGDS